MVRSASVFPLSRQSLQQLKDKGFRFVLVRSYATDRRVDYIEIHYFTLIPVMQLSDDPNQKEIYEPIDSEILLDWADAPSERMKVIVEMQALNET